MNGEAERAVRTLKDCLRAQLHASKLPQKYWDYALEDCITKLNATPRARALTSPHHLMFKWQPKLPLLALFGAHGYIPYKERKKSALAPRGIECRY